MHKREPVIIAPDYTDDELYEWMRQYLAVASGGDFTGAVCLVVNVASSGEWACLRGLWWRLCLHGVDVAARCGWRETDSL